MDFSSLGLSDEILKAVNAEGYSEPTPIQAQAIPAVLDGKDVMAAAQTGTGKTAGFTLPILQRLSKGERARSNHARVLVLTPTRELAAQVRESVETYGKNLPIRSQVVFGGVNINPQMMKLRKGVEILVATPGRLLDLYQKNAIKFNQIEVLVLDEADRMLDMGFIHDIKKILAALPKKRQNLMFSATFSDEIRKLAKGLVHDPVEISVTPRNSTVELVDQWICPVDKKQKTKLLIHLINENKWEQVLVFSRTKHGANKIVKLLEEKNIKAAAIHGNKSQGARTKALDAFKNKKITALIATDIAARGIDIDLLPNVVNFDLPNVPEDYVHRIGRTGRAGATGQAISLVCADEIHELVDIEHLIKQLLPRKLMDGFEPVHDVPPSSLDKKPKKPKKPKPGNRDGQRSGNKKPGNRSAKPSGSKPGKTPFKKPGSKPGAGKPKTPGSRRSKASGDSKPGNQAKRGGKPGGSSNNQSRRSRSGGGPNKATR